MDLWPGLPSPLGSTWDGRGTNFAVFSEVGRLEGAVSLCLFDDAGQERRLPLQERTACVWHGYVPGVGPGQRYGFRVTGPYQPSEGWRFNPSKLLLDPYARAIDGELRSHPAVFGSAPGDSHRPDDRDSAPVVPRSVVTDPSFDWGDDAPPGVPLDESVLYEVHVKGITATHPEVPPQLRGTYTGFASPPVVEHLRSLGVTAVELLPVHHFVSEPFLANRGLRNYWGYNTVGFFAPYAGYSSSGTRGEQVTEFKTMVRALHASGIEVILDVVYNHTGEGGPLGPTVAFRGLDNPAYYWLDPDDSSRYLDYTGTGNTVNVSHPEMLRLIMNSLRYWVTQMRVDGFRFDLASALARDQVEVDRLSSFFDLIYQDPVLSRVKLIAEPWDIGDRGYQVGNFPAGWAEWNDQYRNGIRDFWRGASSGLGDLGYRLTGSSDLYGDDERTPTASINFVTAHDGFTLTDLVSYHTKHNEANGEGNRDGTNDNRSQNFGVEGPTDDPEILALRDRQRRNLLATLLLSQGVPMLLGGDELGRTQQGNNNAYCQDNEISWYHWDLGERSEDLLAFTREVTALRRAHRVFRRRRFLTGRSPNGGPLPDIGWFRPDGEIMTGPDWSIRERRSLGVFLNGSEIAERGPTGERLEDDSFLVLLNADAAPVAFQLPAAPWATAYEPALDTRLARGVPRDPPAPPIDAGKTLLLDPYTMVLLRAVVDEQK